MPRCLTDFVFGWYYSGGELTAAPKPLAEEEVLALAVQIVPEEGGGD